MLFLKRSATAFGLFLALTFVFFIGALAIGGAIVGGRAGAHGTDPTDFNSGYEAGRKAGQEFGQRYGSVILLGACGVSFLTSVAVSFSGVLPWCKRKPQPPKLPGTF